ncbi:hypothetical protein BKA70DRAFT_1446966 [Coprinopsis sp. MPI-PUGE-AT-0042]|nr:hypothetical protein BKA70DRAFT_1446966 [Coprinopsis sp. MPI-PUGE-AT-0042]
MPYRARARRDTASQPGGPGKLVCYLTENFDHNDLIRRDFGKVTKVTRLLVTSEDGPVQFMKQSGVSSEPCGFDNQPSMAITFLELISTLHSPKLPYSGQPHSLCLGVNAVLHVISVQGKAETVVSILDDIKISNFNVNPEGSLYKVLQGLILPEAT